MDRKEIKDIIDGFMVDELEVEGGLLGDDALIREDLGLDSIDFVDIVVIVESKFGFKIKPEDMKELLTLGQFYDYVGNNLRK